MPNPTLNLDDIKLPEEDADKAAEINLNPVVGDDGIGDVVDDKKEDPEKVVEDPKGGDEDKDNDKKEEEEVEETEEEKKAREEKEAKEAEEKKKKEEEEKLTPFHEHPDWKKMVAEREEDKKVIEKLSTQIETLIKVKGVDAEGQEQATLTAKDKIKKDLEAGWKPKDQLEIVEKYGDYLLEEIDQKKEAQKKQDEEAEAKRQEAVKEAETQINTFWTESKIESDEQKEKIINLVIGWQKGGMISKPTIKTLELARDVLQSRGELKEEKKEDKIEKVDKKEDAKGTKEDKDKVNKKISKPTPSGDKALNANKKSYSDMNKKSLDDIVNEAAAALG